MKKYAPLSLAAALLVSGAAFAADATAPNTDITRPGFGQSEVKPDAAKTEVDATAEIGVGAAKDDKAAADAEVKTELKKDETTSTSVQSTTETEAKTPAVDTQTGAEVKSSTDASAASNETPAAGVGASAGVETNTTAPNVQKLFGLFHSNKQTDTAQKQETTPTSTQNTQTQQ